MEKYLRVNAVEVELPSGRKLYSFPIDGKRIPDIATVARVRRTEENKIVGFQRPEVRKHIQEITEYIENSIDAMIPNAIVIAFSDKIIFSPIAIAALSNSTILEDPLEDTESPVGRIGILTIPLPESLESDDRPGWIVDGQQRTFAIKAANVERFPIMVCAFFEKNEKVQAEQFVNVNNVKTLPSTLINELLPNIDRVPTRLVNRQIAARITETLAHGKDTPFNGLVKSTTTKSGVVALNSIVFPLEAMLKDKTSFIRKLLESNNNQLESLDEIALFLKVYWRVVSELFNDVWGLKPGISRLMHGTGIWALMFLANVIKNEAEGELLSVDIQDKLEKIVPYCHWTKNSGDWKDIDGFGQDVVWNGFQNTARDKQILTSYLIRKYRENS